MDGPLYREALGELGIEAVVPDADDAATVDRIIFDELVDGVFTTTRAGAYHDVIVRLAARGVTPWRWRAPRSRCSCAPRTRRSPCSTRPTSSPPRRCAKRSPERPECLPAGMPRGTHSDDGPRLAVARGRAPPVERRPPSARHLPGQRLDGTHLFVHGHR